MQRGLPLSRLMRQRRYQLLAFLALLLLWLMCLSALNISPFIHDPADSYTLQALAWRTGHIHLPENVPHLELAIYEGNYYVSFPPVPTLPQWVLTFFYGENTPNIIVNLFYFLSSYFVGYSLCRRLGKSDGAAALWSSFLVAGCNLLNLCWFGGVWYQAQALSFLLTLCALRLMLNSSKASLCLGLCALALSVGCRPFQAAYLPAALWMTFIRLQRVKKAPLLQTLVHMASLCIPPFLIGIAMGLYNLARFDSFFEFGHTYLPEFQEYGVQFSLSYVSQNIMNILRLPFLAENRLDFPRFNGFAFYLCNPLYLIAIAAFIRGCIKKRLRKLDIILAACLTLHFVLLLLHRTFGGWQFGARYLIDLCPVLFYLSLRHPGKGRILLGIAMAWGVLFNIYGGLLLHLT